MEHNVFQPVSPRSVKLLPGILQQRFDLNRGYLLSNATISTMAKNGGSNNTVCVEQTEDHPCFG